MTSFTLTVVVNTAHRIIRAYWNTIICAVVRARKIAAMTMPAWRASFTHWRWKVSTEYLCQPQIMRATAFNHIDVITIGGVGTECLWRSSIGNNLKIRTSLSAVGHRVLMSTDLYYQCNENTSIPARKVCLFFYNFSIFWPVQTNNLIDATTALINDASLKLTHIVRYLPVHLLLIIKLNVLIVCRGIYHYIVIFLWILENYLDDWRVSHLCVLLPLTGAALRLRNIASFAPACSATGVRCLHWAG